MPRIAAASLAALALALAVPAAALAHASVSPPVVVAGTDQVFTLAVPTEEENATTTTIELTLPGGFGVDSFVAAPGWTRKVAQTGSGENATISTITWTGGHTPTGEASVFQFVGSAADTKTYDLHVTQTYSNGKVVDWSGPEGSDAPAPTLEAVSSLSGGGGSSTLEVVALVLAGIALVVSGVALLGGKRQLA
jgi:uncharacterized protein YcnI